MAALTPLRRRTARGDGPGFRGGSRSTGATWRSAPGRERDACQHALAHTSPRRRPRAASLGRRSAAVGRAGSASCPLQGDDVALCCGVPVVAGGPGVGPHGWARARLPTGGRGRSSAPGVGDQDGHRRLPPRRRATPRHSGKMTHPAAGARPGRESALPRGAAAATRGAGRGCVNFLARRARPQPRALPARRVRAERPCGLRRLSVAYDRYMARRTGWARRAAARCCASASSSRLIWVTVMRPLATCSCTWASFSARRTCARSFGVVKFTAFFGVSTQYARPGGPGRRSEPQYGSAKCATPELPLMPALDESNLTCGVHHLAPAGGIAGSGGGSPILARARSRP